MAVATLFKLTTILLMTLSLRAAPNDSISGLKPPNKRTIQWMVQEVPPFIMIQGNDAIVKPEDLDGPLAGLYKVLTMSLPDYEHRFVRIPLLRVTKMIKEENQMCSLVMIESKERHSFLYFGEEVTVGLPVGIVTLQSASPEKLVLSKHDEVDMKQTLEKKQFRLGFVTGRFYTPQLTPIISKNQSKSYGFISDGSLGKLLSMLQAKRLDGVLAVYLEMAEYERAHPHSGKMQFHRLKQAQEFTALRASCEKTPWGKKAIKEISKVIRDKNFKRISNEYLMSVLPPERRKEYQKIYDSRPPALETTLE